MNLIPSRRRSANTVVVVAATAAVVLGMAVSAAQAAPKPAVKLPTGNVIVVLRNQHSNLSIAKGRSSARVRANHSDQAPLLVRAKSSGARNLHGFSDINGFSATVTAAQAAALAKDPSVAQVFPDLAITKPAPTTEKATSAGTASPVSPSDVCPADPTKPLLEPEALGVTNTAFSDPTKPQAQNLVDGTGVKVAYIADGIDINNPDFIRADGMHVFIDYQDFSGEGPNAPSGAAEAFGDASSIAAQGRQVYDLANYVNPAHPLPAGCNITIRGMAPGASLIGLKVFGNAPTAPTSRFIQAIDYAVGAGAEVLNESFGGNPFPDTADDPITLADNAAIAAGVTVTASTGDAGTSGTVGSPASSTAGVIGVGATTTFRSYLQQGYAGSQFSNGTWLDNNISGLSSGGTTQSGGVPDLVAPGDLGWALCSPNTDVYTECFNDAGEPSPLQDFGGTSQSSPLTAGAAALVIEAYQNAHHGTRPAPALVKQLLTSTATDLGHPASEQGSGLLDSLRAVQAAQSWHDASGAPARQGAALVVNKSQLKLSGNPSNSRPTTVKVTNVSATTQTVRGTTRSFEDVVNSTDGTATINTATAPTYVDSTGVVRSYTKVTFTVGAVDRLDVFAAANTAPFAGRIILIDPTGAYAAYSIPQGAANYAHSDIRYPAAGTWTAYLALSRSSGFNGTFAYSVVQTDFTTHGTVTPSKIVLAPGKTGTFLVHTHVPGTPGDLSASVQFTSSGGVTTSVPMTLRADIPPYDNTFSAAITGGNGRAAGGVAQSNLYYLNVPSGKKDLSIGVTFTDPNQHVFGILTAPDGQVYSFNDNSADGSALQLYRRNPQAGRWLFDLEVTNPVSGLEVRQGFTARIGYNTVKIRATLPTSAHTKLAAGVPVTVPVTVTNTGVAPETYFADGRLDTLGTIGLADLSSNNGTLPLPVPAGVTPFWLVPTETKVLTASAVADQPVNLDFFFQSGDPDVYGAAVGNTARVEVDARQVSPGEWAADIGQTGPFPGPAPAGTVSVGVSAVGQLFDPAVTSDTGDFWREGVADQSALSPAARARLTSLRRTLTAPGSAASRATATPAGDGPLTLDPGQTATIMVTITPSGTPGSVVRGHLYIDTANEPLGQGEELIDLPYAYTIK